MRKIPHINEIKQNGYYLVYSQYPKEGIAGTCVNVVPPRGIISFRGYPLSPYTQCNGMNTIDIDWYYANGKFEIFELNSTEAYSVQAEIDDIHDIHEREKMSEGESSINSLDAPYVEISRSISIDDLKQPF